MIFLERLVVFALLELIGIMVLKYSNRLVVWIGTADLAESYIPGGTVGMWKIIGVACTVGGLLVLFGSAKGLGL